METPGQLTPRSEERRPAIARVLSQGGHSGGIVAGGQQSWVEAGRRANATGLPGRVQLAPAVWLCCVYLSAQNAERVDADCETQRLEALLQAAADSWHGQEQTLGTRIGSCIFCFKPRRPEPHAHSGIGSAQGFLIRIQSIDSGDGELLTRLEFAG